MMVDFLFSFVFVLTGCTEACGLGFGRNLVGFVEVRDVGSDFGSDAVLDSDSEDVDG